LEEKMIKKLMITLCFTVMGINASLARQTCEAPTVEINKDNTTYDEFQQLANNGFLTLVLGEDILFNPKRPKSITRIYKDIAISFAIDKKINDPTYSRSGYKFVKGHRIEISGINKDSSLFTVSHKLLSKITFNSLNSFIAKGHIFCTAVIDPGVIEYSILLDGPSLPMKSNIFSDEKLLPKNNIPSQEIKMGANSLGATTV